MAVGGDDRKGPRQFSFIRQGTEQIYNVEEPRWGAALLPLSVQRIDKSDSPFDHGEYKKTHIDSDLGFLQN